MATLREQVEEVRKSTDKLMSNMLTACGFDISAIAELEDSQALALRDSMKLMDDAMDLYVNIATEIDRLKVIESKLDLLIAKKDK